MAAPSTGLSAFTNADFNGIPFNVGGSRGWGLETSLSAAPIRGRNFGAEEVRIQIEVIEGNDGDPDAGIEPTIFYRQAKYMENSSPIDFASWEENTLILAEVDLRDGNDADAIAHVNAVRASHGLDPLAALDMDTLIFEREKEFFAEGYRLVDQRRFDVWHLGDDTWQYLPITQSERNNNENF